MYFNLLQHIETKLSEYFKSNSKILSLKNVSGGCINDCFEFVFNEQKFFVKVNSLEKFPGMFAAEKKGLDLLAGTSSLVVPEPVLNGEFENQQYLVLTYLQKSPATENYFSSLGNGLAQLHKNTTENFGLDHANYIGALPQKNTPKKNFADFFFENRLEFQVKLAVDSGTLDKAWLKNSSLYKNLNTVFPSEKPTLLHGDLWSGNAMSTRGGPAIFDPAIYFGHRESDIAMTLLFGGFPQSFYEAYENEFPLEKNWQKRTELFNLYPLLVHLNLFGNSYKAKVESILEKYS